MKKPGTGIVNAIKNRKKCNTRCFIFEICPLMALSLSKQNVGSTCLLNKGGNALIRRFVRTFVNGEQGLIDEINNILYLYGLDIEVAPAAIKKDYATLLMNWHKQQFVDSKLEYEEKPKLTVVINELGEAGTTQREIIPIVEAGHIRLGKQRCEQLAEIVEISQKEDPNSILSSPLLDQILNTEIPISEAQYVPKQNSRIQDGESSGTQSAPKELEKTPEGSG